MIRFALRAAILLMLGYTAWAAPSYAISKEFDRIYPLEPGGSFELQNVNGTVEVQSWDKDAIEIHAVKIAKHSESDLERVAIEVDAKPGAISVATRYPQNEGVEVSVEYVIHAPHGARIEHLGTVNGTLRIVGIETIEDLHTVNGDIEVYDGGGALRARTTNGNIHLELAHPLDKSGSLAETTNGSVLLALPSDTHADLETRCLNGNFSSELPVILQSTVNPREMHGKLGHGGAPIRLRTVNGGIQIVILRSTI